MVASPSSLKTKSESLLTGHNDTLPNARQSPQQSDSADSFSTLTPNTMPRVSINQRQCFSIRICMTVHIMEQGKPVLST